MPTPDQLGTLFVQVGLTCLIIVIVAITLIVVSGLTHLAMEMWSSILKEWLPRLRYYWRHRYDDYED